MKARWRRAPVDSWLVVTYSGVCPSLVYEDDSRSRPTLLLPRRRAHRLIAMAGPSFALAALVLVVATMASS